MERKFEPNTFHRRLSSMLAVDLRRLFTTPLLYVMLGISFALPVLILVMTTMFGGGAPQAGAAQAAGEAAMPAFTNVWQAIASESGGSMGMDLTSMCNINMLYFLAAVLVCTFTADDFRSGYAKNLFTVRAGKSDYVISKTLVGFAGAAGMLLAYFAGALAGGAMAGLSFDLGSVGIIGLLMCMLAKICLLPVFVALDVLLAVIAKQKLWLSILGSLMAGMLLFMMIPMLTPLDATPMHVLMCLAGGALFGVGLGAVSGRVLKTGSLV